jgi:hypothetical protein
MVAEIALNALGSALAVVLMYVHSHAAFGDPVPRWLSRAVCIRDHERNSAMSYTNNNRIHLMNPQKANTNDVHTTVS